MATQPISTSYSQTVLPLQQATWVTDLVGTTGSVTSGTALPGIFGAGDRITSVQLYSTNMASLSLAVNLVPVGSAVGSAVGTLYSALGSGAVAGASLGAVLTQPCFISVTGATISLPASAVVGYLRME